MISCARTYDKIHEGIVLPVGNTMARIYMSVGSVLADGDAQRSVWSVKGAAWKLPCVLCKNVLTERTDSDYLVHVSCPNPQAFDLASSADIWEKCDNLHRTAPPVFHEDPS